MSSLTIKSPCCGRIVPVQLSRVPVKSHSSQTRPSVMIPMLGSARLSPSSTIVRSYTPAIIVCRSRVMTGLARVTASKDGHVLEVKNATTREAQPSMFASSASDVIDQAHMFIVRTSTEWHNDTNPSDFGNYLIALVPEEPHDPALTS